MAEATFHTNPVSLQEFLKLCHTGQVQLLLSRHLAHVRLLTDLVNVTPV